MIYIQAVRSVPAKLLVRKKLTKKGIKEDCTGYNALCINNANSLSVKKALMGGFIKNVYIRNVDSKVIKFVKHF